MYFILRAAIAILLSVASSFHACRSQVVESVPVDEQDYEEVIEEYEEEILVQEGAPEPFGANFVEPPPTQGKPRCITLILNDHWIYIYVMCIYITGFILKLHA